MPPASPPFARGESASAVLALTRSGGPTRGTFPAPPTPVTLRAGSEATKYSWGAAGSEFEQLPPRAPSTSRPRRSTRARRATHLPSRPISEQPVRDRVAFRQSRPGSDWQLGRVPRVVTGLGLAFGSRSGRSIRENAPHSTAIPALLASKIWQSTANSSVATTKNLQSNAGPPRL